MQLQWQDLVLSTCILGYNIALFPTIYSKHKPHTSTGLITAFFQVVAFVVYISLGLWYSASMALLNATLWMIIVFQKMALAKKKRTRRR